MDVLMIIAIVGFAVLCGGVSTKIAAGKGRNPLAWGTAGLVLNLLGLLIVIVVPSRADDRFAVLRTARPATGAGKSGGAKAAIA